MSWKVTGRARCEWAAPICKAFAAALPWAAIAVSLAGIASGGRAQEPAAQPREPGSLVALVALEDVLVDTIARCEKSVVSIARVRRGDHVEGNAELPLRDIFRNRPSSPPDDPTNPEFVPNEYGTGVVIDAAGLILTNYHVVVRAEDSDRDPTREVESEIWVTTVERRPYRAKIVGADPRSDLAVLSIESNDLTPIPFGDAAALKKGQFVIALGNPYAIARDGQVSATWGIVANLARKAGPMPSEDPMDLRTTLHHYGTLIQTDAKLNLGTSGGPLLNLKGEMVGLTTSQAALAGYEQAAGYAIPVDDAFKRIIDDLKHGREVEYGFLGIAPDNLTAQEILAGAHGMRISTAWPGMPASRAGLEARDVVLAIDGQRVYDRDTLMLLVGRQPAEAVTRVTVMRNGLTESVDVELGKYPVRGKKVVTAPRPAWRGIQVDYASMMINELQQRAAFGGFPGEAADFPAGVSIMEVARDSAGWKAGMRRGMIISHVGGSAVQNPREFLEAVADREGSVEVRVAGDIGEPSSRRMIAAEAAGE